VNVHLTSPEALWLALPACALVVLIGFIGRRAFPSRGRLVTATIVRCLMLTLLAAALAGPYLPFTTKVARKTLLLADRSGSVSKAGREEQERRIRALRRKNPASEVSFGDEESSDPRSALLRAAARSAERILISTDGHLDADGAPLIEDLVAGSRTVGALATDESSDVEAGASPAEPEIVLPDTLKGSEEFSLEVRADGADSVEVRVDGRRIGQAPVRDGTAVFPPMMLSAGRREIVAIADRDGVRTAAAAAAVVEGPLPVLVFGADGKNPVVQALVAQGLDVSVGSAFVPGKARVVIALPEARLPSDGGLLTAWVQAGGGLLVATGVPPGLGEYREDPVADLLPAVALPAKPEVAPPPEPEKEPEQPDPGASPTEVEKEAATLSILIVMDRSGSMSGIKIAMAREACYQTALTLDEQDRIGVLAFNERNLWIQRPGPAGDLAGLRQALVRLTPAGQTDIYGAMKEAAKAIRGETASIRHVILVSDGQDAISGFHALITGLKKDRITVTTVGVGRDYEGRLLGRLAEWGGGRFWDATDPNDLPRVVTRDARRVLKIRKPPDAPSPDLTAGAPEADPPAEPAKQPDKPPPEPPVTVRSVGETPLTAGLEFPALPEVEPATARFPALTALVTEEGHPALLLWRYGAGRVALMPADPAAWAAWPDLGTFLGRLVTRLAGTEPAPDAAPPGIELSSRRAIVTSETPPRLLTVEIAGEEVEVPLERTGTNRFEGEIPVFPPGALIVARVRRDDGAEALAALVIPVEGEATDRGVNRPGIERLAAAAGRRADEVPPRPPADRRPGREPIHIPLLAAALLLLPVDVAVRRLGR
jgi:hypothetical protein